MGSENVHDKIIKSENRQVLIHSVVTDARETKVCALRIAHP